MLIPEAEIDEILEEHKAMD
ncbi:MAG: hypothetical protein ACFNXX_02100 [Veillonella parvula]